MNLNEFLNENLNKENIGEMSLNESFQSSVLSTLAKDKNLLKILKKLSKKGVDLYNTTDEHIFKVSAKEAFKLKTDNYIKFWFQGDTYALITVGNKRVTYYLDPTRSKWDRQGSSDYQEWTGKALKNLSSAYVIDLNTAPTTNALKNARIAARADIMPSADVIKKTNLERYRKLIAEQEFSSGNELDLITNITRHIQKMIETVAPLSFIVNPPSSYYYGHIKDYTQTLLTYIQAIEENEYDLEKVIKNDWHKSNSIKADLERFIADIKIKNTNYLTRPNFASKMLKLMTSEGYWKDYKGWLMENSNAKYMTVIETIEDLNEWCNKNIPNIIISLKFTSIVELEIFATLMEDIRNSYQDIEGYLSSLYRLYEKWVETGRKESTLEKIFGTEASESIITDSTSYYSTISKLVNSSSILKRKLMAIQKIVA
jgi:hypothetical protein